MKIALYNEIVLLQDVPDAQLLRGDVATLVDYVTHPRGGELGVVLEVFNAVGDSIAVVTVPASAITPLRADQMPAVRALSIAA